MDRCRLIVGLVLIVASAGFSQDAPANPEALALDAKLIAEAKDHSEIMKNLQYLSDIVGPRLTGSANLRQANDWTASVMKSYGLSNVRLEPWEIPLGWERGTASMKLVDPDNGRSLTVAAAGWTPGTKGKITGPVVILNAKTREDFAKYKGKLKDAIVLRGEPAKVAPITDLTYGPPADPKAKQPEKKTDDKEKKADDKEQPKEPKPVEKKQSIQELQAFRRELSDFLRAEGAAVLLTDSAKPHNLLVTTGTWRGTDRANASEPLPALFVAHEHFALLHRLATRPAPAVTKVEVEITNKFIPGPVTVYNTVGEIPGEKADEFVTIGAHLDSWDLAQGTTDNGTGSCVVLETARVIAKSGVKPKRTIRFVLFTGEEQGLFGSKAYVKRHADEMPKTSVALVHDTGTGKVLGFGLQGREAIKPIMDRELISLKSLGFTGVTLRGSGGTDHLSFEDVGVPGFACNQDMDEYRLTHHTPSDTFDKAKEPNLIQGAQVLAVSLVRVANLPDLLPRQKPGNPKKESGPAPRETTTEKK
ncbi:M20/M25/M40 family metallo-hydrolase [Zavarzinella formosa]|uniref:M20/M25/M40 family metallo-hydrolase n=1 Tax=Zavarzinella formosa TaxID=360055 RepID=UPI00031DFAC0|nr:M20/M25/M40 family metallo-hydrolase [Zavarzinella formosa]